MEKGVVNRDSEARAKEEESSEESRAYMVIFLNTSLDSNYACIVVCIQLLLYIHVCGFIKTTLNDPHIPLINNIKHVQ